MPNNDCIAEIDDDTEHCLVCGWSYGAVEVYYDSNTGGEWRDIGCVNRMCSEYGKVVKQD